ncbi:polyprenyl diphosphate synthase [Acinetobacter kookii]|uniref:Ditrans,polycis-undecaprenyl-diphosphate synthase ((2E,6E)-farnesyl-diphosphate specific) n=1 Tax=Acinetobacter kookii TaxID=1226327 RepID=A0A1G6IXA8_9GAMM|nr:MULTISPECIES: polyprenyl diphosphate synthase [Acinetobacter]MCT8089141.1 di-trans,poly-cis-decaprenylcistransferase [Acinetobacter sp. F_3_1]MCT8097296.1 di-trans,poly-cis-decaprenylcistransferase [Acinetobacter sp. C_3_1]MCT8100172.1 di-trans,poly-cis-decaprenylcistransferase [Acinetobacter sp. C_4_1]MCT8133362.1 di-trans,poly-cis-decaprenylcistransferase [Acinetobacter sp. T_3_1]SDC11033.1 undecaprenyl diphosphate synthase [Acinetobacter kookii]
MTVSEDSMLLPKHVAIIMDGNNRFAKKKQMQKGAGHREGKNVLDPIVEHCRKNHIQALTVFAFSSENWNRPQFEVDLLMALLEETIHEQLPRMEKFNIALRFIGDRSRLSDRLRELMLQAEQRTAKFDSMTLTIAISYGGMWDMAQAAKQIAADVLAKKIALEDIDAELFGQHVCMADLPAVDLLIRTGGDYRLSNFLLWQAAYAELYFTPTLWPEFTVEELDDAFAVFAGRERRFGKTSEQIQQEKLEN